MHLMKTNSIYVNKTEIYGYLSVLGVNFEGNDMLLHEVYNERQRSEVTQITDIILPLYENCLAGSNSKTSQTKM